MRKLDVEAGAPETQVNGLGGRQAGLVKEGNSTEPQGLREMKWEVKDQGERLGDSLC